ncbi:GmrSD restriction endonuclease domain-containing protein [Trichothermofontia sp.]
MTTFDSTKRLLPDILRDVVSGTIQLPDFQRGWIWDDNHIQSLLVSIGRSFPVGAIMLLETGGAVRFQMRPVENVSLSEPLPDAAKLILDGQQRLTTLTQVLCLNGPVKTRTDKGKAINRYYYFHIPTALEGPEHLEDALLAVDDSRQVKSDFGRRVDIDLSSRERECHQLYFPCNCILSWSDWLQALSRFNGQHLSTFLEFQKRVIDAFNTYQIPIIELKKETSKEAVCLVFEKVNTGGVPLSVFELVTASYAADGYNLRDDWFGSKLRAVESRKERLAKDAMLSSVEATDFLQAVTLLYTLEKRRSDIILGKQGKQVSPVSAKRSAVLELPLDAYQQWANKIEYGFRQTAKFLRKQSFYDVRELPYRTQLLPLAAVLTELGERWLEPRIYDKLTQWFWCGILGELYGGSVETRVANDVEELLSWFEDDTHTPRTVLDASFQPDRLDRLTSRLSAAYKGINVLVLREGARDFFWKASINELDAQEIALDIHHIFPRSWCEEKQIPKKRYDTIVNKTTISYKARSVESRYKTLHLRVRESYKRFWKQIVAPMDERTATAEF